MRKQTKKNSQKFYVSIQNQSKEKIQKKKDCKTKNFYEVEKKDKEIENTRTKEKQRTSSGNPVLPEIKFLNTQNREKKKKKEGENHQQGS